MSMKNQTIIVYSNKEIDESGFNSNFEKLRYISPKFFNGVKDVKYCTSVYTNLEKIASAYARKGIPQHKLSPLYGKTDEPKVEDESAREVSDSEFDNLFENVETFDDTPAAPEEEEEDVSAVEDSEDGVEAEEDHLSDEDILELPFFSMKSEINKKYGTSPKNKKEAFEILGVEQE